MISSRHSFRRETDSICTKLIGRYFGYVFDSSNRYEGRLSMGLRKFSSIWILASNASIAGNLNCSTLVQRWHMGDAGTIHTYTDTIASCAIDVIRSAPFFCCSPLSLQKKWNGANWIITHELVHDWSECTAWFTFRLKTIFLRFETISFCAPTWALCTAIMRMENGIIFLNIVRRQRSVLSHNKKWNKT